VVETPPRHTFVTTPSLPITTTTTTNARPPSLPSSTPVNAHVWANLGWARRLTPPPTAIRNCYEPPPRQRHQHPCHVGAIDTPATSAPSTPPPRQRRRHPCHVGAIDTPATSAPSTPPPRQRRRHPCHVATTATSTTRQCRLPHHHHAMPTTTSTPNAAEGRPPPPPCIVHAATS
jgi:hypothetical protein